MPKELKQKLKKQVKNKKWREERKNAYVYGTLRKIEGKPKN